MRPYYQDDHVTLYHGDCLEILPALEFDVIVTDPPYGINLDTDYSSMKAGADHRPVFGDDTPFDPAPFLTVPAALFGVNHYASRVPDRGTWHVWDKVVSGESGWVADFETWWTSWGSGPSRIFRYGWVGTRRPAKERGTHPTVKPVPLLMHIIGENRTPSGIILDPFAGTGTTLRAAKDLGRTAIGIEIDERYCEIAARRMAQEVLDFGLA